MKAFRLPAVLFALLLIVAACSSPGTSPSSDASEAESQPASQAEESEAEESAAAEMPD